MLVHWERCLQGSVIPQAAAEPARADSDIRAEQPLRVGTTLRLTVASLSGRLIVASQSSSATVTVRAWRHQTQSQTHDIRHRFTESCTNSSWQPTRRGVAVLWPQACPPDKSAPWQTQTGRVSDVPARGRAAGPLSCFRARPLRAVQLEPGGPGGHTNSRSCGLIPMLFERGSPFRIAVEDDRRLTNSIGTQKEQSRTEVSA